MGRDSTSNDWPDTYLCPVCGSEVKVGAAGCPHCAQARARKRPRKPWEMDPGEEVHDPDLPAGYEGTEDFDYDAFVEKEFGDRKGKRPGIPVTWQLVLGALLILVLLLSQLRF